MKTKPKAYIAGIGMINSIGADTVMISASVKAQISGYKTSDFFNMQGQPITLATVPDQVFSSVNIEVDHGNHYSVHTDRIIKIAIIAMHEAIANQTIKKPIPLVLAMPEISEEANYIPYQQLINNLVNQKDLPLRADGIRFISTGRAASILGLDSAIEILYKQEEDYVLIGGSDSHRNASRLYDLDEAERLSASNRMDGFVLGEGAGFLLLTRDPERALARGDQIIALTPPGSSQEPGHYYSDQPYRGDGLDQAFKHALSDYTGEGIDTIYTSMNGEHYWAKEYGVAVIRNKKFLKEDFKVEHPADCFGDLGVASGSVLIGLAADHLLKQPDLATHLVTSSSDGAWRAAVRVEKISRNLNTI
ncbi:hypothetical protein JYT31_02230 [Beggiatoa alba]|nr:hypothetical protein [Beggiatoa alba]